MTDSLTSSILIFTDGACTGNPGPGGWGSIVLQLDGTVRELGGGSGATTNNRMEMTAAIEALALLASPANGKIVLYTDSSYVIKGITQWVWGWKARGWKNAEGKDVANRELWEAIMQQVARLKPATIDWRYVKGHAGFPGNERCDEIAVSFAKSRPASLYSGPRSGYSVDLDHVPASGTDGRGRAARSGVASGVSGSSAGAAGSGAPGRSSASSAQSSATSAQSSATSAQSSSTSAQSSSTSARSSATSARSNATSARSSGAPVYLSYFGGVVKRHSTWSDCERLVKGRNARYKKVKSAVEERETLRSWGLDPDSVTVE